MRGDRSSWSPRCRSIRRTTPCQGSDHTLCRYAPGLKEPPLRVTILGTVPRPCPISNARRVRTNNQPKRAKGRWPPRRLTPATGRSGPLTRMADKAKPLRNPDRHARIRLCYPSPRREQGFAQAKTPSKEDSYVSGSFHSHRPARHSRFPA